VLATAILGSSLAFVEGSVVNLALPAIQTDLETTSAGVQWVMNAYLLVLGSFMLVGGSLGDRYGLRIVFMLGTVIFGAGALGCALADSLPVLISARMLQGFGGALLVPTSLALIGSHFDAEERGRAIGTWAGASALTTAAGPVIGGWVVDVAGWPAVFLLVVPLAALTTAIAAWRVPVSPTRLEERLDYPGAVLLAASLALLLYGLVSTGPPVPRVAAAGLAIVGVTAFLWREARYRAPMLPLSLFRSRRFSGANLITLLLYGALSGAFYFLPFNLIQVQGYSALQAGAAFLPFTLILGFGSTFAGGLLSRMSPRVLLTIGPAIAAAGFAALAIPSADASYVAGFLPGIVVSSVGMTLSIAPLTTVVLSSVGEGQSGVASGVNNTAARLAGVLAVAALTAVAIGHFSAALEGELRTRGVPAPLVERLSSDASRLAELGPPEGTDPDVAAAVRASVASAYVDTFRILVLASGALAALGGLIAWVSLGNDVVARRRPRDGGPDVRLRPHRGTGRRSSP
jgi:EmrB/QacA subfamily drug resistance transporter